MVWSKNYSPGIYKKFKHLKKQIIMEGISIQKIWVSFISPKVSFCVPEAWHCKTLTVDNLKKGGFTMVRSWLCLKEESI